MTPAAARQRISRAGPHVRKLPLHFAHRERFLYLDSEYNSDLYWLRLLDALDEAESAAGLAVHGLWARGGAVPEGLFGTISGLPHRLRKHLSFETVLARAIDLGLFKKDHYLELGACIML